MENKTMKVIVLHGSSRKGGNSDTLIDKFLAGMQEIVECDIDHFYAIDMNIAHCRGCGSCKNGKCIIDDDMQKVYPVFSQADVVILACPVFWGYMTSQLKTLFDRLEAIASPEHFGGKEFIIFITYRHYYGSLAEWLDRIAKSFKSRSHAIACQTYDDKTNSNIPISEFPDKLKEAFDLGKKIAGECK